MIFESDAIINRGSKATTVKDFKPSNVRYIMENIFIGLHNAYEISQALYRMIKLFEIENKSAHNYMISIGLGDYCYQDLDGLYHINFNAFVRLLELDSAQPFDTVEIGLPYRKLKPIAKDVSCGVKQITSVYTRLIKDFNDGTL